MLPFCEAQLVENGDFRATGYNMLLCLALQPMRCGVTYLPLFNPCGTAVALFCTSGPSCCLPSPGQEDAVQESGRSLGGGGAQGKEQKAAPDRIFAVDEGGTYRRAQQL